MEMETKYLIALLYLVKFNLQFVKNNKPLVLLNIQNRSIRGNIVKYI